MKIRSTQEEIKQGIDFLNEILQKNLFRSKSELARALDVTPVTLNNWLTGVRGINPASLQRIKEMHNQTVSEGAHITISNAGNSVMNHVGNGVAVGMGGHHDRAAHDVLHIYRDLLIKRVIDADFMDDATKFKVISLVQTTRLDEEG